MIGLCEKLSPCASVRCSCDGEMKTGPGRKRERDRKSRKIVQNLLGRRGGRGGRAVIAEIRAKRNDADAGKRVRRE